MSEDIKIAFLAVVIVAFILGMVVGGNLASKAYTTEAIEHNAAHYDSKTGVFTWNK